MEGLFLKLSFFIIELMSTHPLIFMSTSLLFLTFVCLVIKGYTDRLNPNRPTDKPLNYVPNSYATESQLKRSPNNPNQPQQRRVRRV